MSVFVSNVIQATAAPSTGEPTPATSWQWKRSGASIPGATASSYIATVDDAGQDISVIQTASNVAGTASATSVAVGPVLPFTPDILFAGGAPGAWYDPSDYATMFQNAAGSTPVTGVEQDVALILDKSQGLVLGPELASNSGNPFTSTAAFIDGGGAPSVVGGKLRVSANVDYGGAVLAITTVADKWYYVETFVTYVGGTTGFYVEAKNQNDNGVNLGGSGVSVGLRNVYFKAISSTTIVGIRCRHAGAVGDFSYISVRELAGNHAFQATPTSRPRLSARYNLLTKTEDFGDATWRKSITTITQNAEIAPNNTLTADALFETSETQYHAIYPETVVFTTAAGQSYTLKIHLKANGRTKGYLSVINGGDYCTFDLAAKTNVFGGNGPNSVITGQTIEELSNGWFLLTLTVSFSGAANVKPTVGISNDLGVSVYAGDTTKGFYIWGASLVPASQSTLPYQRVNTATDYNSVGFVPYLKFDGIDDGLSTNSINFTSTDKMSVFAGVRKLSDAAVGIIAELSADGASNAGGFFVATPLTVGAASDFAYYSRGSVAPAASIKSGTVLAPTTKVITATSSISTPDMTLRLNAVQVANSTASQGGNNYGNYPLYIGRRATGAPLPFNGHLYNLLIVGKAVNPVELTVTESYINSKTGAY